MVARLGLPLTEWPAPMSFGAAGKRTAGPEAGGGLAAELAPLGFTVDFAPDTDVTIGPKDPTIGARSMSGDPARCRSPEGGILPGHAGRRDPARRQALSRATAP